MGIITALLGYAIGTVQVLLLDWKRSRLAHARSLRVLKADLERAKLCDYKFALRPDNPPASDHVPRPPFVGEHFVTTVVALEFSMTDEHPDDSSLAGLLSLADACDMMARVHGQISDLLDKIREDSDQARNRERWESVIDLADVYDSMLDTTMFMIQDALRDLNRRISEVQWRRQLYRATHKLAPGVNPEPLRDGDPRIAAFRVEHPPRSLSAPGA
jgi:hypothetical protein